MTIPRQHTCQKCAWSYSIIDDPNESKVWKDIAAHVLPLSCAWENLWRGIAYELGIPRFVEWLSKQLRKRDV